MEVREEGVQLHLLRFNSELSCFLNEKRTNKKEGHDWSSVWWRKLIVDKGRAQPEDMTRLSWAIVEREREEGREGSQVCNHCGAGNQNVWNI